MQVARLKPKRSIKMMDLSDEITNKNKFLECIRYTASESVKPNEYLLPEYLATCCKKDGIEGIKYYGSREYKNYVCRDELMIEERFDPDRTILSLFYENSSGKSGKKRRKV